MGYSGGQESGVFKAISVFGKTIGVAMAILVTPAIYSRTRAPMLAYLSNAWGHEIGKWLTWTMAGVEAYGLYTATTLIFTSVVVWTMARAAADRFSGE